MFIHFDVAKCQNIRHFQKMCQRSDRAIKKHLSRVSLIRNRTIHERACNALISDKYHDVSMRFHLTISESVLAIILVIYYISIITILLSLLHVLNARFLINVVTLLLLLSCALITSPTYSLPERVILQITQNHGVTFVIFSERGWGRRRGRNERFLMQKTTGQLDGLYQDLSYHQSIAWTIWNKRKWRFFTIQRSTLCFIIICIYLKLLLLCILVRFSLPSEVKYLPNCERCFNHVKTWLNNIRVW